MLVAMEVVFNASSSYNKINYNHTHPSQLPKALQKGLEQLFLRADIKVSQVV